ncbi:MAG: NAD(P)-dependent oxidoreductase [Nocardioides sp.]|nr:NAD(P)-dependent oxidoreductase [Nocardioides sp.]
MKATVVGTGIMGAAMAGSLARDGHEVVVWNRTPEKAEAVVGHGVRTVASLAEAVTGADVVLTSLFDADAVLAVADEIAAHLDDGAVWVQTSTVGPAAARQIASRAPGRVLDAPVLGTRKPAEDGTLVVLASGPPDLVERARPALDAIGSRTLVVNDATDGGSSLKLATNAWVGLITAGTAQSLGLAAALGVDPSLVLDALAGGAADSAYAHLKGAAMLEQIKGGTGDGPVSFALDGVRKDLDLMIGAAQETGFPLDLLSAVKGVYDRASSAGHGEHDLAAVQAAFLVPGPDQTQ